MKKKFFFIGGRTANAGPSNVNASYVNNADSSMDYVRLINIRFIGRIEQLLKLLFYKNIVISGINRSLELKIASLFKKRIYYIMHGCAEFENAINKQNYHPSILQFEKEILEKSYRIIAVSENYSNWVRERYPQYTNKIRFVNNGMNLFNKPLQHTISKANHYAIAVAGGNRYQKCNIVVCKAVEKLNSEGYNIKLKVFGRFYAEGDSFSDCEFVEKMGHLNLEDYYKKLANVDLFVVNSEVESFGLVVADALNCGCSLLMSTNVGALSVFSSLKETDIVQDNHDINELAAKIAVNLKNGNHDRLLKSVDRNSCSEKQAYLKLKKIVLMDE